MRQTSSWYCYNWIAPNRVLVQSQLRKSTQVVSMVTPVPVRNICSSCLCENNENWVLAFPHLWGCGQRKPFQNYWHPTTWTRPRGRRSQPSGFCVWKWVTEGFFGQRSILQLCVCVSHGPSVKSQDRFLSSRHHHACGTSDVIDCSDVSLGCP